MLKISVSPEASMNSSSPTERPFSSEISRKDASIEGTRQPGLRRRRRAAPRSADPAYQALTQVAHQGFFIWHEVGVLAT